MTENTYCPEIKETLKGYIKSKQEFDSWGENIHYVDFKALKRELQTHLIHAEKDLIDVDEILEDLDLVKNSIKIACGDAFGEHPLPENYEEILRETIKDIEAIISKKQLRKTEIEENIKLLKENLK